MHQQFCPRKKKKPSLKSITALDIFIQRLHYCLQKKLGIWVLNRQKAYYVDEQHNMNKKAPK